MKVPAIKKLCETYSIEQLREAEDKLLDDQAHGLEVEGDDEGEQLTHIMAAIWCLHDMKENSTALPQAVRNYTVKVRNSIS
ncbi:MAG: hypothetical protein H7Y03_00595 [Chitinophagaceae bacterium]|nr:hypothetical protein [Chitinophagaceae bacterium]